MFTKSLELLRHRKELFEAEARGDKEFLDRAYQEAQLNESDWKRVSKHKCTPISEWPDEDHEG